MEDALTDLRSWKSSATSYDYHAISTAKRATFKILGQIFYSVPRSDDKKFQTHGLDQKNVWLVVQWSAIGDI